jgi:hypothetical protein
MISADHGCVVDTGRGGRLDGIGALVGRDGIGVIKGLIDSIICGNGIFFIVAHIFDSPWKDCYIAY